MDRISALVRGMSDEEKTANRACFLHFMGSMAGSVVCTEMVEGRRVKGIFHTGTAFPGKDFLVCLKATRAEGQGSDEIDMETGSTMILREKEWANIASTSLDLSPKTGSNMELQTDGAIRGKDISHLMNRELVAADDWIVEAPIGALESKGSKGVGAWDQFEANTKLKDYKKTHFDENLYTKKLDMSTMTPEQIRRAEKLAREIDSQVSSNIHLQEERGHALERDVDEEALYSGVIGTGGYAAGAPKGFNQGDEGDVGPWKRGQRTQSSSVAPPAGASPRHGDAGSKKTPAPAMAPNGRPIKTIPAPSSVAASNDNTKKAPPPKAWGAGAAPLSIKTDGNQKMEGPPPGLSANPPSPIKPAATPPLPAAGSEQTAPAATAPASIPTAVSSSTPQESGAAASIPAVAATKTETPSTTPKLSAAAKEWKPNTAAPAFVPKSMPSVPGGPALPVVMGLPHAPYPPPTMTSIQNQPYPQMIPQFAGMPPQGYAFEGQEMPMGMPFPPYQQGMPLPMMVPNQNIPYGYQGPYGPAMDRGYPDDPYSGPYSQRGGYNDFDGRGRGRGGFKSGPMPGRGGGGRGYGDRDGYRDGGYKGKPTNGDYDHLYHQNDNMLLGNPSRERQGSFDRRNSRDFDDRRRPERDPSYNRDEHRERSNSNMDTYNGHDNSSYSHPSSQYERRPSRDEHDTRSEQPYREERPDA